MKLDFTLLEHFTNLTFPVLMCFVLMKYIEKIQTEHKEELKTLSNSLDENTKAINNLADKIKEVI